MAKPPRSSSHDVPHETDEDLWQRVTETTQPLKRGRDRAQLHEKEAIERSEPTPARSKRTASAKPPPAKPPPKNETPPLGSFDRREVRGLGAGRIDIDGRIDLHGMRQREAHEALKAFLVRARSRGHRHVLVITGKGSARTPDENRSFYDEGRSKAGVLRNAVPHWLNEPGFREMVVSFTTASPRHGGEGALYVRLRKAGKV